MYIQSRYNFLVNRDNHHLMYNALTKSLVALNDDYYGCIDSFPQEGKATLSQVESEFLRTGFLVSDEIDEYQEALVKYQLTRYSSNEIRLIIAPTIACNFECSYCFEQKRSLDYNNANLVNDIVSFVKEISDRGVNLAVTWYGGEPLLEIEYIEEISKKIKQNYQRPFRQSIITNGYLLTRDNAARLSFIGIGEAQVTLDGLACVHDTRRKFRNGGPTFQRIVENISEASHYININVRMNVDKTNADSCIHLLEYLKKEGLQKKIRPYISPVEDCNTCRSMPDYTICTSKEFAEIEKEFYREAVILGFEISPLTSRFSGMCDAVSNGAYVINPDGSFGKCWDTVGDRSCICGRLSDNVLTSQTALDWLTYLPSDKECARCRFFPVCYGGCPRQAMERGRHSCLPIKYNIEELIFLEYYSRCNIKK